MEQKEIVSYWDAFALIDGKEYRKVSYIDGHAEGGMCTICGPFEIDKDNKTIYCKCKHMKYERVMYGEPSPYVSPDEIGKELWMYPVSPRSKIMPKLHILRRFWYWLINKNRC